MRNVLQMDKVDYKSLDWAKNAFIEASKATLGFAREFGFVPDDGLGASANLFILNLLPFVENFGNELAISLVTEGLGTADDSKPDDLSQAELLSFWRNIAFKTLSTLTNDAASSGLQSILVSLYLPSSTPQTVFTEEFMEGFLQGFIEACRIVGCVYISGETPQLKTKIFENHLDIAGAVFAVRVPESFPIHPDRFGEGNFIVLFQSSGPHENGFTTLRGFSQKLKNGYRTFIDEKTEFWNAINAPSILYTPLVRKILLHVNGVTGIENITGHGWQKIMRSKKPLNYVIEDMPAISPVFEFLMSQGLIDKKELFKTFNCGSGLVMFLDSEENAQKAVSIGESLGLVSKIAGGIHKSDIRKVSVIPHNITLSGNEFDLGR